MMNNNKTQSIMNNDGGIHCKVSLNDQFRRFFFTGTEFTSLYSQVQQMLALDTEFVLKYKDNEDDLVTISSDEELKYAISVSNSMLRIIVEVPSTQQPFWTGNKMHEFGQGRGRKCGRRGGYGGRYAPYSFESRQKFWEQKKAKQIQKKEEIETLLASFPKDRDLTPDEQSHQQALIFKVGQMNARLAKLQGHGCGHGGYGHGGYGHGGYGHGPEGKKWQKMEKKMEKKIDKKLEKKISKELKKKKDATMLSPEAQDELNVLKVQIKSMKPVLKERKADLKAKKLALSQMSDEETAQKLKSEIMALKENVKVLKEQIQPLRLRVKEIKYSN